MTRRPKLIELMKRLSSKLLIWTAVAGFLLAYGNASLQAVEPWATYRGNPQRTGKAGPAAPKVLWAYKTKEHFLASPVPAGSRLFVSGLGAFDITSFLCLSADPKAGNRVLWSKSVPYLKLPTVSSPGIDRGRLVFG